MNINEKIEYVQLQLQTFQNLIAKKNEEQNELEYLSNVIELAKEILKNIEREKTKEIEDTVQATEQFVREVGLLSTRLKNTYEQIYEYDEKEIKKLNSYLQIYAEFKQLTLDIQIMEKLSKKSKDDKTETENAEGRKKKIDTVLVEEYNELVERKRQISRKALAAYNAIMDYNIEQLKKKETEKDDIVAEDIEKVEGIEEVKEEIVEEKQNTNEERLDEIKKEMQEIIDNCKKKGQGKKIHVTFEGKKYDLPKKYYGQLLYLNGQKKKYERIIEEEKKSTAEQISNEETKVEEKIVNIENTNDANNIEAANNQNIENAQEEIIRPKSNAVLITDIEHHKEKSKKQKLIQKIKKVAVAACLLIATSASILALKNIQKNIDKAEIKIETVQDVDSIDIENETEKIVQKIEDNLEVEQVNDQNVVIDNSSDIVVENIEVVNSETNVDKEKIDIKNDVINNNETVSVESIDEVNPEVNTTESENVLENKVINNNETVEVKDEASVSPATTIEDNKTEDLVLQDSFNLNENSQIYSSEYEATSKENGKHPYFGYEMERQCAGIVFELPNGEVKVARNDEDIQNYTNIGGTVTGYLAQNENGLEGFYNKNDVIKLQKNLGGGMNL